MTPQLYALRANARTFIMRNHSIIFFAALLVLLLATAASLYLVTTAPANATPDSESVIDFNQKTVDQIKNLHDSTDGSDKLVFPTPRSNPFVEK